MTSNSLVDMLVRLRKSDTKFKSLGICSNLIQGEPAPSIEEGIKAWLSLVKDEKDITEVDLDYPIEGSSWAYCNNPNKWDRRTKFGKKRYELLDFLIEYYSQKDLT